MATVVAGLGCSHAPSIAHAYDSGATREPEMKPLFDVFAQRDGGRGALRRCPAIARSPAISPRNCSTAVST
jgi:hypothetical protein